MQALELEAHIDEDGRIFLPREFQHIYGKSARLLLLLPESSPLPRKRRQPGSAKGILQILIEDDEHLHDFEEYMP